MVNNTDRKSWLADRIHQNSDWFRVRIASDLVKQKWHRAPYVLKISEFIEDLKGFTLEASWQRLCLHKWAKLITFTCLYLKKQTCKEHKNLHQKCDSTSACKNVESLCRAKKFWRPTVGDCCPSFFLSLLLCASFHISLSSFVYFHCSSLFLHVCLKCSGFITVSVAFVVSLIWKWTTLKWGTRHRAGRAAVK